GPPRPGGRDGFGGSRGIPPEEPVAGGALEAARRADALAASGPTEAAVRERAALVLADMKMMDRLGPFGKGRRKSRTRGLTICGRQRSTPTPERCPRRTRATFPTTGCYWRWPTGRKAPG